MIKRMAKAFLLMNSLLLYGCVTLGPRVEKKTVFVDRTDSHGVPVKIGQVEKNIRVPVTIETEKGDILSEEIDIGGWNVSPPVKQDK